MLFVCSHNIDFQDTAKFKIPSEGSQVLYICIKGDRFVQSALWMQILNVDKNLHEHLRSAVLLLFFPLQIADSLYTCTRLAS